MVAAGIGVFAITNLSSLDDRDTYLFEKMMVPPAEIASLADALGTIQSAIRDRQFARCAGGGAAELDRTGSAGRSVSVAAAAGSRIARVVPDIRKTATVVQEVSAASREQDSGVTQNGRAIVQLDSMVQRNASASEELASMAEEPNSQAEQLSEALSFCKSGEGSLLRIESRLEARPSPSWRAATHETVYAARMRWSGSARQAVPLAVLLVAEQGDIDWDISLPIVTADHAKGFLRFASSTCMEKGALPASQGGGTLDFASGSASYLATGHSNEPVSLCARDTAAEEASALYVGQGRAGTRIVENTAISEAIAAFLGLE